MNEKEHQKQQKATVLRCKNQADFLATLPVLMGYHVTNSIVLTLFNGNRTASAARCDLPDKAVAHSETKLNEFIIDLVKRLRWVTSVAIVVYTDESFVETTSPPRQMLALWLAKSLRKNGIAVRENLCVAKNGWTDYNAHSRNGTGRPLSDLNASIVGLEAKTYLKGALPKLAEIGKPSAVAGELSKNFDEVLERSEPVGYKEAGLIAKQLLFRKFKGQDVILWSKFIKAIQTPTAWFTAALILLIGEAETIHFLNELGPEEFERVTLRPSSETEDEEWPLQKTLQLFSIKRIPAVKLREIITALTSAYAHTPTRFCAPLASFIAWCWWMGGMATPANVNATEAFKLDPKEPLVQLVRNLIDGDPPLWVFDERVINAS